jgi:hypothetical protein
LAVTIHFLETDDALRDVRTPEATLTRMDAFIRGK